jgi:hypothetical protein
MNARDQREDRVPPGAPMFRDMRKFFTIHQGKRAFPTSSTRCGTWRYPFRNIVTDIMKRALLAEMEIFTARHYSAGASASISTRIRGASTPIVWRS